MMSCIYDIHANLMRDRSAYRPFGGLRGSESWREIDEILKISEPQQLESPLRGAIAAVQRQGVAIPAITWISAKENHHLEAFR